MLESASSITAPFMMDDEIISAEMSSFIRKWGVVLAQSEFHRPVGSVENSIQLTNIAARAPRPISPRIGRPLAISVPRGQTGRWE
jgi:hypothetical protein